MAIVVPTAGEVALLDKMLHAALSTDENYTLKLYSNNYTPIAASVAGNFTECTFTNYTSKTLTRANFGPATVVSSVGSSTYASAQTWTCGTTGQTVYGYYVVGATSGTLLWAEQFGTARTLASGDTLTLTPALTLQSQN